MKNTMTKTWKQQEEAEHGVKPFSKAWYKLESKEGHKAKIGSKAWRIEESEEGAHRKDYPTKYFKQVACAVKEAIGFKRRSK
jgi:hypothetical protein